MSSTGDQDRIWANITTSGEVTEAELRRALWLLGLLTDLGLSTTVETKPVDELDRKDEGLPPDNAEIVFSDSIESIASREQYIGRDHLLNFREHFTPDIHEKTVARAANILVRMEDGNLFIVGGVGTPFPNAILPVVRPRKEVGMPDFKDGIVLPRDYLKEEEQAVQVGSLIDFVELISRPDIVTPAGVGDSVLGFLTRLKDHLKQQIVQAELAKLEALADDAPLPSPDPVPPQPSPAAGDNDGFIFLSGGPASGDETVIDLGHRRTAPAPGQDLDDAEVVTNFEIPPNFSDIVSTQLAQARDGRLSVGSVINRIWGRKRLEPGQFGDVVAEMTALCHEGVLTHEYGKWYTGGPQFAEHTTRTQPHSGGSYREPAATTSGFETFGQDGLGLLDDGDSADNGHQAGSSGRRKSLTAMLNEAGIQGDQISKRKGKQRGLPDKRAKGRRR